MSIIRTLSVPVFLFIALTGCKEELTYSNLMQHPNTLKQAITRCQEQVSQTQDEAKRCQVVMSAADNMLSIITDQQNNPEQFGQQILDAEIACVKAREALQTAQQSLDALQAKQASPEEIKTAQDKVVEAKKIFADQHDKVKVMLAVLGMNSPE